MNTSSQLEPMSRFIVTDYLNTLNKKQRYYLNNVFERFPVMNTHIERKKLIENGRKNYPNGFELDPTTNEVIIFSSYTGCDVK